MTVDNTFRAVTWNVFGPTPADHLAPHMADQLRHHGVSLFFMQEAGGADLDKMCRDHGLETYSWDQYRLAWMPTVWVWIRGEHFYLSDQEYRDRQGREERTGGVSMIFCDRYGRSLEAVCYHTPAHIQVPDHPERRVTAAFEAMATLGRMADETLCRGFLAAGDDNVDEFQGYGVDSQMWLPMLARATGLHQVQAPNPTLGDRRIDDFRYPVHGAIKVVRSSGWTDEGGGTDRPPHRIHGEEFTWVS